MRVLLPFCVLLALACGGTSTPPRTITPAPEPSPEATEPDVKVLETYGWAPDSYPSLKGTVHMGVDDGNLRERPEPDAPVVATLPLGAEVTVLSTASEPVVLTDRLHRWLKVRSEGHQGYVFGALLTPFGGTTFDEDHGDLPWAVSTAPDGRPRVRVKLPSGVQAIDLTPTERFTGGSLKAEARVWGDFGTEIEVEVCPWEPGDCAVTVARLHGRTLKQDSVPDQERYAPTLSDEPSCATPQPLEVKPSEVVEERVIGLPPMMMDAESARCVRFGTGTGPLQGRTLVDCAMRNGGKVYKERLESHRFAVVDAHHWISLPCASTLDRSYLAQTLQEQGVRLTENADVTLAGPYRGPIELEPPFAIVRHEVADLYLPDPPVFTHPELGPVYRDEGILVVPQPQGHLALAWDPQVPGYLASPPSCAGDIAHANVVPTWDPTWGEPTPLREHEAVQLYTPPEGFVAARRAAEPHPDLDTLELPWLLARPHDRWTVLVHEQLKPELLCEPIVYLYSSEPRRFRLDLDARIQVHGRWPRADWQGVALPDGRMRIDSRTVPHLFWDGDVGRFAPPSRGWSIPNDASALADVLHDAGLRGREIDEAIEAWTPILPTTPWLRIGLHDDVDALAPLHLTPRPDTSIRVLVEIEGTDGPVPIEPPRPVDPHREGFTLVEWGWVQR